MTEDNDGGENEDHRNDKGKPNKPKDPTPGKGDYPVGYKRPPAHTQFKPGQSGNPKGRKIESKNTSTLLAEELNQRMSVTENGRQRRITKRHAIIKRSVNAAINDPKVGLSMLQNLQRGEAPAEENAAIFPRLSAPEYDRIIENFLRRVRASHSVAERDQDEESPGDAQ
jgi:hypothetical protein